jgi:hypothetical protein
VPLCIDSSVPGALEAGLEAAEGRPLLNSVTGEEERLEVVLPLVKKYNVPVVAISNDDTGISEDPDVRFSSPPRASAGAFPKGTPVLTAARQLGVDLDSVCGGRGICSKCQITPVLWRVPQARRHRRR